MISAFSAVLNSVPPITLQSSHVVIADSTTEYINDFNTVNPDWLISLLSPRVIPRAMDKIGDRIGAINIDPIITEALFNSKPKLAIRTDMTTRKKNDGLGAESLINESMASALFFSLISLNNKYI